MLTASIRDLRTRFPRLRELIERDGEIIVTDRGKPAFVLRLYVAPKKVQWKATNYYRRLKARQPRPLSASASAALDEADRAER